MFLSYGQFYFFRIIISLLVIVHCYNESFDWMRGYSNVSCHGLVKVHGKSANTAFPGRVSSYKCGVFIIYGFCFVVTGI